MDWDKLYFSGPLLAVALKISTQLSCCVYFFCVVVRTTIFISRFTTSAFFVFLTRKNGTRSIRFLALLILRVHPEKLLPSLCILNISFIPSRWSDGTRCGPAHSVTRLASFRSDKAYVKWASLPTDDLPSPMPPTGSLDLA